MMIELVVTLGIGFAFGLLVGVLAEIDEETGGSEDNKTE
jgi:hypothetical protein